MSCLLAGIEPYDRGSAPYEDVALLVRLRNWQVHYRSRTITPSDTAGLGPKLAGRFEESRLMADAGNPFFPDKALGAPCARWCVSSARDFADDFVRRVKYRANYQMVDHPHEPPPI